MQLEDVADHLRRFHHAVLSAVDSEGYPHVTRVMQHFDGEVCRVSLTDDRVKTRHLRIRPRATLHVPGEDPWHWVSVVADAELSEVAADADGDVAGELLGVYEAISGKHDDAAEFRREMVEQQRLVLRLTPRRVYGQV